MSVKRNDGDLYRTRSESKVIFGGVGYKNVYLYLLNVEFSSSL